MKNIFLFIRQYFNFLSFLLLQILCIVMLTKVSKTHETFFAGTVFEVTGYFNSRYANLQQYFNLKEANQKLAEENTRLRNALGSNFISPDTTVIPFTDSSFVDTLGRKRKFIYLPAKVIGNSYTLQNNYLMLERGANQGIKKGMAVVGPSGIVGVVVDVSDNISKVMSLLHRNSKVSAMLKKDNTTGSIEWDGADPSLLVLRNISKSAKVVKGDTVLTSAYSANFPSQLMIGRVASITADPATNYYTLKIKTATNFFTIQSVDVIYNTRFNEQIELENRNQ
ncbi:rod shape-determining protein MreC [Sediminibacterium sp.]|uniref:rod shape-determining protein MreC n=1 Tax=Sediminibacterium sp. TaxID=1917865 RepID=UPI00271D0CFD|nr:rod shape-determining protein MreC [Sediminibacterium sp.]MDO8995253.1 rod shape-determining protein MreC [Sediminibacterium sp.]MDP1972978.1 rod shape-determining protein MreC [Sediminibacterium sp.]MDP2422468.1 rod shape-determining protein MreC [Sediminibacterium sp.]